MTSSHPRFASVLVANRGEIARRVIRACRDADLRTVAVHSDADAGAPHVHEADVAVRLGPTPAAESYLHVERLLAAAAASGAEAVHPGYGFLSENAGFARAVREAGLVWIGPTPEVIDLMGRKDHAREVAERAGVPVTRRYPEDAVPPGAYPVLVKAAAGGGGKGMHVVREPAGLADAVSLARREARAAFGDDTLLVERYVERGRHVEVQVVGDEHGGVVHLGDRDCSAQRRHQKVVEEAPAPDLDDDLRRRLHQSSVALCREVGYTGAGTVEFLVEGAGADARASFLEMNTRLQVEHPVTEEVTGIDLVSWQLEVAQGRPLPLTQDEIRVDGHAIEVRVYAEDPYAGFVPQTGRVQRLLRAGGARHEWGVEEGSTVGTAYDPMLGKVVVTGPDRRTAAAMMGEALRATAVLGVVTNIGFLHRLVGSRAFRAGEVHTSWLDGPDADELVTAPSLPGGAVALAAQAWADEHLVRGPGPWELLDGWRAGGPARPITVTLLDPAGEVHEVPVVLGPRPHHLIALPPTVVDRAGAWVVVEGHPWRFDRPDPARRTEAPAGDADVVSPMPGTVIELGVSEGDRVTAGQRLGAVEAMKMELALTAPHDGVVASVAAGVGDQVAMGHVVLRVDPDADPGDAGRGA